MFYNISFPAEPRLDYLINNAGIMSQPFAKTEDGNESHFQTNYLGQNATYKSYIIYLLYL